jgi:hypothetical protein
LSGSPNEILASTIGSVCSHADYCDRFASSSVAVAIRCEHITCASRTLRFVMEVQAPHCSLCRAVLRQATLFGSYNREIVGLQDGGCVALDWWKGSQQLRLQHTASSTPIVLILHGLTGTLLTANRQHFDDIANCLTLPRVSGTHGLQVSCLPGFPD